MSYLAASIAYVASLAFAAFVIHLRTKSQTSYLAARVDDLTFALRETATLSAKTDAKVNTFAAQAKALADTTETVSLLALRSGLRGAEKPRG
jgi:hypothetical protein